MQLQIMDIKQQIKQLNHKLQEYNVSYRIGQPIISDTEYDSLLNDLVRLESDYPEFKQSDSVTLRIGIEPHSPDFETVSHTVPMLSLDNTYSMDDLMKFLSRTTKECTGLFVDEHTSPSRVSYSGEAKIDGCAVSLIYEKGILTRAITRGDGIAGDDITDNARTIGDIPLRLTKWLSPTIEIRGEIYMRNSTLDKLNSESSVPMKNPRNATAGSIKLKDSRQCAKRYLSFIAHTWISGKKENIDSQYAFWNWCNQNSIPTCPLSKIFETPDDVKLYLEELYSDYNSDYNSDISSLDCETDGYVIKLNSLIHRDHIGNGATSPLWAKAYKVTKWEAESIVEKIVWDGPSSYGTFTPVAELSPIDIAGSTVKRATLHNIDIIRKLRIKEGDRCIVAKCGKIIPGIVRSLENHESSNIDFPSRCPSCNDTIDIINDVPTCINISCPARICKRIEKAVKALDIDGIGPAIISQMVDKNYLGINSIFDLFQLDKEQILSLPRMGEKSADKIIKEINSKRNIPIDKFIVAIGIQDIGPAIAKKIVKRYNTLVKLVAAEEYDFAEVVGNHAAECFYNGIWHHFEKSREFDLALAHNNNRIIQILNADIDDSDSKSYALSGMTICVTGSLENYTRKSIQDIIKKNGGISVDTVTKKTTHLLVGSSPGSKLDKASSLGITILNETEFQNILNNGTN